MILAADIGGTNSRLGLFERDGGTVRTVAARTFPSRAHDSLEAIVTEFRAEHRHAIDAACFAVAGPVRDGRVLATNLAWVVDAGQLAATLDIEAVGLINDLEAVGHGLAALGADDMRLVLAGAPSAAGNLAIIAAGTGLGEAGCYWDGRQHHPFASEGGHTDFAPRTELEMDLLRHLLGTFERASYERVLSGTGLFEIYRFLHQAGRGQEPASLTEVLYQQAHPAPIVRAALEGRSTRCAEALDLFVSIYGAEAGNLALKLLAMGGVYVAGGIAPRIVGKLGESHFRDGFTEKGRMRPLLEAIPVHVILNDKVGLLGAARYAASSTSREGPA